MVSSYKKNNIAKRGKGACTKDANTLRWAAPGPGANHPLPHFWLPFGSILAPIWLPLVHFWVPFGSLGSFLVYTFGTLGLTFARLGAQFTKFWNLSA